MTGAGVLEFLSQLHPLGNRERAGEIFDLNKSLLARPDLLPVGLTIMLPPRENAVVLEPVESSRQAAY